MGYFSNGTEGELYFDKYCSRCIFDRNHDCPIWGLHLEHNYKEANNAHSFLHKLIPISKDGYGNDECKFFILDNYQLDFEDEPE